VQWKSAPADNKQNVTKMEEKWKNKSKTCSATKKYQTVGEGNKLLGTHHLFNCSANRGNIFRLHDKIFGKV